MTNTMSILPVDIFYRRYDMISANDVRKHASLGVTSPELKEVVRRIVAENLQPRSKWLQAFIDHGRTEPSASYIANELNVLANRKAGEQAMTQPAVKVEPTSTLTAEYFAKRAGWLPKDVMPVGYDAIVARLEAWRKRLEARTGSALTLVHSLRGSANKTNMRSNHRPENGGTAADFQPIGTTFSVAEANRWLDAARAVATELDVNQVLIERSDKGMLLVHVDVKTPGKRDIRITDKTGRSIGAPQAVTVDSSTANYLDRVMTALFKYPRLADIDRRQVADILRIESGNVVGKPLNLRVVNAQGYAGPFQFGWRTWNEVAPRVPGARIYSSERDYINSVKAGEVGSAADYDASALALAELWNAYSLEFDRLKGAGSFAKLAKIDKGIYTLHQRGPRGAVRFLSGRDFSDRQSKESVALLGEIRRQYARS